MKYRKYKTTFLSSLLVSSLLLSGCVETGESFTESEATSPEEGTSSITDELRGLVESELEGVLEGVFLDLNIEDIDSNATLTNAENVLTGLLNGDGVDINNLIEPFLNSIVPLVTSTASENIEYYNVDLKNQYDGDTGTFVVNSGYTIAQDQNGDIIFNDLTNGELGAGEQIKIRSLLIDTPEMEDKKDIDKDGDLKEAQPYAKEARDLAITELKNANSIVAAYDVGDRQDPYSRQLMYIWCDGQLLQETLVKAGLAKIAYVTPPNSTYLEVLETAEEEAKANNRGIWSLN